MSDAENQVDEENTNAESAMDEPLGEGGKRALEAEREANKNLKKELQAALARIGEFEDAQRSDEEKQQHKIKELEEELTALRSNNSTLEHQILVSEVVTEVGLPVTLAGRLKGESKEELLEDAKSLMELVVPEGPRKPAPVPEAGRVGSAARTTADQFADVMQQAFNR